MRLSENDDKIEQWELRSVFGDYMPMWVSTIIFDSEYETVYDVRVAINDQLEREEGL